MSEPDPPDPPRKNANFFDRLDYLVRAAVFLVFEALNTHHELEHIMATVAELQTSLDALTAADAENAQRTSDELAQLQAALEAITPGEPVTQAQLDQVNAVVAGMTARNTALAGDDPAVPTPTPEA